MIVIDVNIISALFIKSDHTPEAKKLLMHDNDWIAPLIWRSEFRHILGYLIQQKSLTPRHANLIMQEAENLMQRGEYEVPSYQILNIVEKFHCSAFVAEYIALASEVGVAFVTFDESYIKVFENISISIEMLLERDLIRERSYAESV